MVSTLIILGVALLALVFAYSLLHGGHGELHHEDERAEKNHDIDVEIFRVLVDRKEEAQLRSCLSGNQFAKFQRRRIRLALGMIRLVDENAGKLMGLGQLAKMKGDAALAQKVDDLIAIAFQLRLNLLLARFCLYLKWLFPSWPVSLPAFEVGYQQLLDSLHTSSSVIA